MLQEYKELYNHNYKLRGHLGMGGGTPYIGHTGMCGLYGWVFLHCKICRNGSILESVPMGLIEFVIIRPKMVKNRPKYHSFNQILQ